ncbi:MAG: asparagine synthetase B [Bacteroidales bacterium]|nr:asparagine synthetase B [Bacteroidales bacterium]MCF8326825.1 asparagine synthetase B [Bacteroidales bacterium]
MKRSIILLIAWLIVIQVGYAARILIPMDEKQNNHLKSYGVAYWTLEQDVEIQWLLNYRGGSFMFKHHSALEEECIARGISYKVISDAQAASIVKEISNPEKNTDAVKLHKAPEIVVYSPKDKQPWDDAVTLVLTYAEIPYDVVYDKEVLDGKLPEYDWLHLHHEDFTGQYGKFWANYRGTEWYQKKVKSNEEMARKLGYKKVSQMKLAVAKRIRDFVLGGGYLFSMCSAPDSFDVALAADGVDICRKMFDGDPMDPNAQSKLNYENCFAFEDFSIVTNPYEYEISNIDVDPRKRMQKVDKESDLFTLFEFSAKWDPIPTMLTQNHTRIIEGFMGQTTAFRKKFLKSDVLVMGENKGLDEARYIHGTRGDGTWTFLSGHDPEDYQHLVGDPPTKLDLHPQSPGYRLILNNILFPAAKKKKRKT